DRQRHRASCMSVRRRRGKWGSETMRVLPVALTLAGSVLASSGARAFDAAAAFGARPSAVDVSLSPDGNSIAFVAPTQGMGSVLYTVRVDPGAKPKAALTASGMPERDGAVLMSRHYLPDEHIGSRVGSSKEGLGVDLLDTRTLQTQTIERPLSDAVCYISDGHGTVRVMGVRGARKGGGQDTGIVHFLYRRPDSRERQGLSDYNEG